MSEKDFSQEQIPVLRRVRCGQCQLPLLQLYQANLLYTLQQPGEKMVSQPLPAYSYRALTDPTPLLTCPGCGTTLSPATMIIVP